MDAVKFWKEKERMCDSFDECDGCPIFKLMENNSCLETLTDKTEEFVSEVEQWSNRHPPMTNGQKFKEVFDFEFPNSLITPDANSIYRNWANEEYKEPKGE